MIVGKILHQSPLNDIKEPAHYSENLSVIKHSSWFSYTALQHN